MKSLRRLSIRYSITSFWISSRAMSLSATTSTTVSSDSESNTNSRIAAIAQLRSTSSKYKNLLDVAYCARLATLQNASMLFLPECFGFIGESSIQTLEQAETSQELLLNTTTNKPKNNEEEKMKNDKSFTNILRSIVSGEKDLMYYKNSNNTNNNNIQLLDGLKEIACESNLWISGGGMHVLGAPPDDETGNSRVYNTHVIIDNTGQVKAYYSKIHLFDVSIPGRVSLRESATTAPGTNLVLCDSPLGKLGLSTCYDVRFPELYVELVRKGAQILLVPSAFTVPTGKAHWHTLLQARAIESQCYVLAAAQYGKHNMKRKSFGHSLAVDPWGKILVDAGGYNTIDMEKQKQDDNDDVEEDEEEMIVTPNIVTCNIDIDLINSIRQNMPIQNHRSNSNFSF